MQQNKTERLWMRGFNPMEDMEILMTHPRFHVIRTGKLIATLMFMQDNGWTLRDLRPDDAPDGTEFNILTFYK